METWLRRHETASCLGLLWEGGREIGEPVVKRTWAAIRIVVAVVWMLVIVLLYLRDIFRYW